ncbi:unnamed protein product [Ectocarpus sp. 6 AP-2014]
MKYWFYTHGRASGRTCASHVTSACDAQCATGCPTRSMGGTTAVETNGQARPVAAFLISLLRPRNEAISHRTASNRGPRNSTAVSPRGGDVKLKSYTTSSTSMISASEHDHKHGYGEFPVASRQCSSEQSTGNTYE